MVQISFVFKGAMIFYTLQIFWSLPYFFHLILIFRGHPHCLRSVSFVLVILTFCGHTHCLRSHSLFEVILISLDHPHFLRSCQLFEVMVILDVISIFRYSPYFQVYTLFFYVVFPCLFLINHCHRISLVLKI